MLMRPLLRYAALYAAVELAAVILLAWTIGLGWTLVMLAATFREAVVLAASQLKGQVGSIRRARANPQGAAADGVLVGLGSFLVFVPGLVSTAAGALMLAPSPAFPANAAPPGAPPGAKCARPSEQANRAQTTGTRRAAPRRWRAGDRGMA